MAALSPNQRQQRSCLVLLFSLAIILILVGGVGFGVYAFATGKFNPENPLPGTGTSTPVITIPSGNGIGVEKAPDGEYIGISDGNFAFDLTRRSDAKLKQQASARFNAGDITGALSLWNQALVTGADSSSDAEVLIYLEDQQVLASGKPYITLVVGTMLTSPDKNNTSDIDAGRNDLQGAYVAQKDYNDGKKLNGGVLIRLLIASSGSQANYATTVAQQVVQAAQRDHTIVGVMGWPYSSNALKAESVLSQAHIPMVSPTASSDSLSGISPYFFRVAPPNKVQAIAGAKYAERQLHVSRVALFFDPADPYSQNLAVDFRQQFTSDGNQIVATETYTVGKTTPLPGLLQDALNAHPQMIYFSGYSDDMGVLLTDLPADQPDLQIMGGDGLYELGGYPPSSRAGFISHLHFTAFAYPDEWTFEESTQPAFFTIYARDFGGSYDHSINPYMFTRPENDAILAYDATLALLQGCENALTTGGNPVTPDELRQGLANITPSQPIQGISGQIGFGGNGDPVNKAIVVLYVDQDGHIKLSSTNGIQNCYLVGQC